MRDTPHVLRSIAPGGRTALVAVVVAVQALMLAAGCGSDRTSEAVPRPPALEPPTPAEELSNAFQAVAEYIRPSVVTISSISRVPESSRQLPDELFGSPFSQFFGDDFLDRFFPPRPRGRGHVQRGLGTGVLVSENGHVLTNHHVVRNADEVTIRLADDRELTAEVVGSDPKTDLAVVRVQGAGFQPAILGDSDRLEVGEWVVAVGNPFGLSSTITAGIISATGRSRMGIADYEDFIQTDAAINPGNSGGPLVNLHGEVVGINTAIASRTGGSMGIGFAIPSNMASSVMTSLIENGVVTRGWLGVVVQELDEDLAASFDYDGTSGALVSQVASGGPAERAGIRSGDIITGFDEVAVEGVDDLRLRAAALAPGSEAQVELFRDGGTRTVEVTLGELEPEEPPAVDEPAASRSLGLSLRTLTPDVAARLGLDQAATGVVVTSVDPLGPAAAAGLRVRDVVTRVQGEQVTDVPSFKRELGRHDLTAGVRLTVLSDGTQHFAVLKAED